MGKIKEKFWGTVKKVDIFGEKVGVNYRGNDTFSTKWGAFISILTIVMIGCYFGV